MVPRPAIYPTIELTAGAAFFENIAVWDNTQTPSVAADLTGYTNWRMQGRIAPSDTATLVFDMGVTPGTTFTITPNPGNISWLIPGSVTYGWLGVYSEVFFDLRVDDPAGNRTIFWSGKLIINPGVTAQT